MQEKTAVSLPDATLKHLRCNYRIMNERVLALIDKRLREIGLSDRAASLAAGLSGDAIRNMRRAPTRQPRVETLMKLGSFLDINLLNPQIHGEYPPESLNRNIDETLPPANTLLSERREMPSFRQMPKDVPVYGVTVGGSDGDFRMNGEVVDRVRRPPGVSATTQAFALYVRGDSMSPRFEMGELVYVNPTRPATPGCDVVVEMNAEQEGEPGACYIKRLVKITAHKLCLREFNPPRDFEIPRIKVRNIWRIYTQAELLGAG